MLNFFRAVGHSAGLAILVLHPERIGFAIADQ